MKQVIGMLLLIVTICSTAAAQQKDAQSGEPADKAQLQKRTLDSMYISMDDFLRLRNQVQGMVREGRLPSPDEHSVITRTYVVLKDGALYYAVPGLAVLMPVPGGGASGCFSLDLPQRARQLKEYIEKLPPRPVKVSSIRQSEAQAM